MAGTTTEKKTRTATRTERPRLYKVILLNDDFTPREFVVRVLQRIFALSEDEAYRRMLTAHQQGSCVIAVYTREVAETKVAEAIGAGQEAGYPLMMTAEPEQ